MTRIFVVETSYLCEFYALPGFSNAEFSSRLREKLTAAVQDRFYVPLGCVYQLCDHVGDVVAGGRRQQLAHQVVTDVESSQEEGIPWVLVPSRGLDELPGFLRGFASDPGYIRIGLTKSEVVTVALNLKRKYGSMGDYRVHIWTKRAELKAYEPDREPNPL